MATPPESDVLVCLAAIAPALHGEFQPRAFLADFSTTLQPFVPHDRLGIGCLSDDGRTFSVFAEHGGPGFLPPTDRYTTDLRGAARFPVADSPLAPVFEGESLCVADLPADPRFADHAAELRSTGLKSAMFVPESLYRTFRHLRRSDDLQPRCNLRCRLHRRTR